MIDILITCAGWVVAILFALAAAFLALAFMLGKLQQLLEGHDHRVANEARRQIGRKMIADAWWLVGEFPHAAEVLRAYGDKFRVGERVDVSKVREEMRAAAGRSMER